MRKKSEQKKSLLFLSCSSGRVIGKKGRGTLKERKRGRGGKKKRKNKKEGREDKIYIHLLYSLLVGGKEEKNLG